MKEIYGIDMEANGQHSKLITDIPDVDIAISMESEDRMEFQVSGIEYGILAEGDTGELTFQGTRYLAFER